MTQIQKTVISQSIKSAEEMHAYAARIVSQVSNKAKEEGVNATVLALYGDLGSGKTTFTQGIAKALSITDTVTSPTFVIEKIYKVSHSDFSFSHLIHIDAYRLVGEHELTVLGFEKILEDKNNLIVIEWADIVEKIIPQNAHKLKFEFVDENNRTVEEV